MGFLEVSEPAERAKRACLVVDLSELVHQEWASLGEYATARRSRTFTAAKRSLSRAKAALAREGIELAVRSSGGTIHARFGTPAIRDLVEVNLQSAQVLVARLDAKRAGAGARAGAGEDGGSAQVRAQFVDPKAIAHDYRERLKPQPWIAQKYGIGIKRVRRILVALGATERREGRRTENRRPSVVVRRALEAAGRGASLLEVAAILGCSARTAKRFVLRASRETLPAASAVERDLGEGGSPDGGPRRHVASVPRGILASLGRR